MKAKILVICTGNSCRSQMAHAFLQSFDQKLMVRSAGTAPAECVNPNAVKAMQEVGLDISKNTPHNIKEYLDEPWDYVITVCGGAKENCPVFNGEVKHQIHIGFDDPAEAKGTEEQVMTVFRRVRDEIKEGFYSFYNKI